MTELTDGTPYFVLTGEIWVAIVSIFENIDRVFNETTLYHKPDKHGDTTIVKQLIYLYQIVALLNDGNNNRKPS